MDALFQHLGLTKAVILGNSLGGVNAYQYAALHPERVRGLIIEDIGVEVPGEMPPVLAWAGVFDSFRERADGWMLPFEPREMMVSQVSLQDSHWADWTGTNCPALVIRGADSRVTNQAEMEEMTSRRANTDCVRWRADMWSMLIMRPPSRQSCERFRAPSPD